MESSSRQRAGATKRLRSRRRLLDGARRCFEQAGYAETAIGDITDSAGVGAATLYTHFPGGKAQLAATLFAEAAAEVMAVAHDAAKDSSTDPVDALATYLQDLARIAAGQRSLTLALLEAVQSATIASGAAPPSAPTDPRLIAPLPRPASELIAAAQKSGAIRKTYPSAEYAALLVNALLLRVLTRPAATAEEVWEFVWWTLLYGLAAPGSESRKPAVRSR